MSKHALPLPTATSNPKIPFIILYRKKLHVQWILYIATSSSPLQSFLPPFSHKKYGSPIVILLGTLSTCRVTLP